MSTDDEFYFMGYARIPLHHLDFDSGRDIDHKNIKRLLHIFGEEGCQQDDHRHSVPVIMNSEVLVDALYARRMTLSSLRQSAADAPLLNLPPDVRIVCLHGKHRIQAAVKFLKPPYQWWTVRIYNEGKAVRDSLRLSKTCDELIYDQTFRLKFGKACGKSMQIRCSSLMATSSDTLSMQEEAKTPTR